MQQKTLPVTEANALKAYQKADANGKAMLSELFGKEVFNQKITDRVKSFLDALEIVGCCEELKPLLAYEGSNSHMLGAQAFAKLTIITEALNEGWQPDWSDSDESKYYAWLEFGSGGWAYDDYGNWSTDSNVGSRLALKSSELAKYAGQKFTPLYSQLFTI